jgi:hypothetical protein
MWRRLLEGAMSGYRFSVRTLLLLVLACTCGFWLITKHTKNQLNEKRQAGCYGNLTALSVALQQYHQDFGCFPPAYMVDRSGKPIHSWRVLVLASAGDPLRSIYDAYDFNEPWNGPNNGKLVNQIPYFYRCPNNNRLNKYFFTNYIAVVGPNTCFTGPKPTKLLDFPRGLSKVVQVTEAENSNINWMEPKDLVIFDNHNPFEVRGQPRVSSNDPGGPAVLFADGTKERIGKSSPSKYFKNIVSIESK